MNSFKSKKQAAMNKHEKTNWFPASTPPERVGVYEIQGRFSMYSKWDGKHWLMVTTAIETARIQEFASTAMYSKSEPILWRGFVREQ